ncbi:MAG: PEP-CTERM sorting domain-containing protein [Myxococcota bacterium]|nr:PEP-CTERM sorting domain-containing protein [Myxococcota bacterium]
MPRRATGPGCRPQPPKGRSVPRSSQRVRSRRFTTGSSRPRWLLAVVLLVAGTARAEVLGWDGTLSLDFPLAGPDLEAWRVEGPGVAIPAASLPALGALHLSGGPSGTSTFLVTDPDTVGNAIAAVRIDAALGFGSLSPLPPHPFGERLDARTVPVFGSLRLCLLSSSCVFPAPLFDLGHGLGVGGTLTGATPSGLRISIQAAPWTLGTATVPLPTSGGGTATGFAFGFVHGPASFTGTTAASAGEIQLVTPMLARSEAALPFSGFGRLGVRFVPEPGGGALLLAALGALLLLARHRSRSR